MQLESAKRPRARSRHRAIAPVVLFALVLALPFVTQAAVQGGHSDFACGECHMRTPESGMAGRPGSVPKWSTENTSDGVRSFRIYSSPSFDKLRTDIGQPDGTSRLCLGCHDGSYPGLRSGKAMFGSSDLARSHPISFTYSSSLAARAPRGTLNDPRSTSSGLGGTIAEDLLDERGKMQCASCHDVHSKRNGNKLLRYAYSPDTRQGSRMCLTCHNM